MVNTVNENSKYFYKKILHVILFENMFYSRPSPKDSDFPPLEGLGPNSNFLRTLVAQRCIVQKRGCKFDKMVCKFDKMGCKILELFHFTQNTFLMHSSDSQMGARKYWFLICD